MGDRLGIHDVVDILSQMWKNFCHRYGMTHTHTHKGKQVWFGAPYVCWGGLDLPLRNVYGHIMLKAPVLVRSLKLSNIESC